MANLFVDEFLKFYSKNICVESQLLNGTENFLKLREDMKMVSDALYRLEDKLDKVLERGK